MKVIGKAENGYIITASKEEIANLNGLYSEYADGFKVEIGDEINIKEMYRIAARAKQIRSMDKELRRVVDCIQESIRTIDFVTRCEGEG